LSREEVHEHRRQARRRGALIPFDLIKPDTLCWGALMASAVLGSVPIAILYSFFPPVARVPGFVAE